MLAPGMPFPYYIANNYYKIIKWLLFTFLMIFSTSCTEKKNSVDIPFEKDGCFYITAYLNDSVKGRFVFDTGADGLYLDSTFLTLHPSIVKVPVSTSKVRGAGNADYREVNLLKDSVKVTIGDSYVHTFTDIPVLKLDEINGEGIAGIIGNEFIKGKVLAVNNETSTLKILTEADKSEYESEIPFEYDDGRIYFRVKLNISGNDTIEPRLLMDLGCPETIILNYPYYNSVKEQIKNDVTYSILYGGILGGNSHGGEFRALSVYLGNDKAVNPVISYSLDTLGAFSNARYDGLIGNTLLDRFNYAIDYNNSKLYLTKNKKFDEPYTSSLTGFYAMKRGNYAITMSIYYQSEAHQNGLQLGDTIIAVNKKPVRDMTDKELSKIMKGKDEVTLTIVRKGKEENVSFTPKYLL